jgi:hypothetical protein
LAVNSSTSSFSARTSTRVRCRTRGSLAHRGDCLGCLSGRAQGAGHPQGRPEFADPDYQLSVEWSAARERLRAAETRQKNPATRSRVLVIGGADRNDGSCPGEMSKTFRLLQLARETLEREGVETDVLDLSLLTSDYGRRIFPCKGCVSTAMPLCHWPCSCYPNHALNQTGDWMNDIYEHWVSRTEF